MASDKSRAQQLAESAEFAAVLQDGSTMKAKAKLLRASTRTIREAAKILGYEIKHQDDLNRAPTDAEDEASLSSLDLAPMIAERVREVTTLHMQYLNGEITSFPWDRGHREALVRGKARGENKGVA